MATRTIANPRDRLTTILIAPLMTCSARIPVYVLIVAAFIPDRPALGVLGLQGLVMFGLYATGILASLLVASLLKRTVCRGRPEPLLLELPAYKLPNPLHLLRGVLERAKIFLRRAGTVIFVIMIGLWALASFPAPPDGATEPAIHYSAAGRLGAAIEPVLAPAGFSWQMAVALVPAMAAREVAVAALGTIYALSGDDDAAVSKALIPQLQESWTLPMALAFLAWFIFAPQCVSTLGVVRRETNSWRWPLFMFLYMTALAWLAAVGTYQLATALGL